MGRWAYGCKSSFVDYLQQSKTKSSLFLVVFTAFKNFHSTLPSIALKLTLKHMHEMRLMIVYIFTVSKNYFIAEKYFLL